MLGQHSVEKNCEILEDISRLMDRQLVLVKSAYDIIKSGRTVPAAQPKKKKKIPKGVNCLVWKQDPSITRIGIRKVYLPHDVTFGPKDDDIEIAVFMNDQNKDELTQELVGPVNGDFLVDFAKNPLGFDMVNCYAIVRMAVNMFMRDLGYTSWKWQWDLGTANGLKKTPLKIICHAGEKPNATYIRGKKCLKFYYITDDAGVRTFLCRSLDIVAHEAGHAILDALKPSLYSVHDGQPGALHEAFGDLTALFLTLDQMDMCEDITAETKCDLRQARYLTAIGEQFGAAMKGNTGHAMGEEEAGDTIGMRNMNNDIVGSNCHNEVHALADIFTGFIFDVLVMIFQWERDPTGYMSDAETLHRTGRIVRRIVLLALATTTSTPDFCDLANAMINACDEIAKDDPGDIPYYKKTILDCKERRELHLAGK